MTKYVVILVLCGYIGYGEYLVNRMHSTLQQSGDDYTEFKEQGIGDLANNARIGIYSDYIEFRMQE